MKLQHVIIVCLLVGIWICLGHDKLISTLQNFTSQALKNNSESQVRRDLESLPNPFQVYMFSGTSDHGFDIREGHIFSCEESLGAWGTDDYVSWSVNGDGTMTLYNQRLNESVTARLVGVRSSRRGY